MKKILCSLLVLAMVLGMFPALAENNVIHVGMISVLNRNEEEMADYCKALWLGACQMDKEGYLKDTKFHQLVEGLPEDTMPEFKVTFFDTMETLVLAMQTGQIDFMEACLQTGRYISANNESIFLLNEVDFSKQMNAFAGTMFWGPAGTEYSFLMLESNAALRDEFSKYIKELDSEGFLAELRNTYVTEMNTDPVEMPVFDGAETIRVAVTGCIPPLDYISADGRPAGFTTALLAEISRRMNKNIQLVVADSTGRAAALSSGVVDTVFWVQSNQKCDVFVANAPDKETQMGNFEYLYKQMTEEEADAMRQILQYVDVGEYGSRDRPMGTLNTEPYTQDFLSFLTTETQYAEVMDMLHGN